MNSKEESKIQLTVQINVEKDTTTTLSLIVLNDIANKMYFCDDTSVEKEYRKSTR